MEQKGKLRRFNAANPGKAYTFVKGSGYRRILTDDAGQQWCKAKNKLLPYIENKVVGVKNNGDMK